ncbi:lipoprotein 17-related variable surface protein [Mycoplasma simbae]|uniref:lipoprotein 17-related variable surface protein n=1 Tax=Mycoplasma simbae TaxID=36744 RepID=UPI0004977F0E|nr:lipoprotein 17-related variable surface protein [Mycoplasma simbae]
MRKKKLGFLTLAAPTFLAMPMLAVACGQESEKTKTTDEKSNQNQISISVVEGAKSKQPSEVTAADFKVTTTMPNTEPTIQSVRPASQVSGAVMVEIKLTNKTTGESTVETKMVEGFASSQTPNPSTPSQKNYNDLVSVSVADELKAKRPRQIKVSDVQVNSQDASLQVSVKSVSPNQGVKTTLNVEVTVVDGKQSTILIKEIEGFKEDYPKSIDDAYTDFGPAVKIVKSIASSQWFANSQNGATLYWDYADKSFYDKKKTAENTERVKLFTVEPYSPSFGVAPVGIKAEGQSDQDVNLQAQLLKENNSYGLKFRLGLYNKSKKTTKFFDDVITTPLHVFASVSQADVDAQVDKAVLDYTNKADTFDKDAVQANVTHSNVDQGYIFEIKEFTQNVGSDSVSVKFTIKYQLDTEFIESKEKTVVISGFKANNFGHQFVNLGVKYEGKETKHASAADSTMVKFVDEQNRDFNFAQDIVKTVTIKAGTVNDYKGTLTVTVSLTKEADSFTKDFEISGFMKKQFDFNNYVDQLATPSLASSINKTETYAGSVEKSSIVLPEIDSNAVSAEITSVHAKQGEDTTLQINVQFTDLVSEQPQTKEKVYEITGFKANAKRYLRQELFALAEGRHIFVFEDNAENRKNLTAFAAEDKNVITVDKGTVKFYSTDKYNKSYSRLKTGLTLSENAVGNMSTNGKETTYATLHSATPGGNPPRQKGISLVKEGNTVKIKFRLILEDGTVDDVLYEQELFTITQ